MSYTEESKGERLLGAPTPMATAPEVEKVPFEPPTQSFPVLTPYFDHNTTFPFLGKAMLPHYDTIVEEMKAATRWHDWPERSLYKAEEGHDWKVFPFVHTFPADDPSKTEWVPSSVETCPVTSRVLASLPGIRTALFSRLGPNTTLGTHQGWAILSNHVLRCHLPLTVPGSETCGLIVDGETMHHKEGEIIVFDDSQKHSAFNHHPTDSRAVLIFDLERPKEVPPGIATGIVTTELASFIDYFK